jgi:hypothetical protein
MGTEAIFEFFADNPPSMAFAGSILMWITGSGMNGVSLHSGDDLLFWAPIVFFCGIIIQLVWLFKK